MYVVVVVVVVVVVFGLEFIKITLKYAKDQEILPW